MTDTTTKVREHYSAMGLTDRIKSALATLAPEGPIDAPRFGLLPDALPGITPGSCRISGKH